MSAVNSADLEEGDDVLVRMREDGQLVAKFVATVKEIEEVLLGEKIKLDVPWHDGHRSLRLAPYEAEFEIIDDSDDVSF